MASSKKTVFFVRHGEAPHNLDPAYLEIADNPLTQHGRRQAGECHELLRRIQTEAGAPFDCVMVSPLTRAIETCLIATGGNKGGTPLPGCPVVPTVCRHVTERGSAVCDRGSPKSVLESRFPKLDFSCLASTDPTWWFPQEEGTAVPYRKGGINPDADYIKHMSSIMQRAVEFSQILNDAPGQRILVFGHGGFFHSLLGKDFKNCEVASFTWPPRNFPPPVSRAWVDASDIIKAAGEPVSKYASVSRL